MNTLIFGPDLANLHEIEYVNVGEWIRYRRKLDTVWYYIRPELFPVIVMEGFSAFDRIATASLIVDSVTREITKNRFFGENSIIKPRDFLEDVDAYIVGMDKSC